MIGVCAYCGRPTAQAFATIVQVRLAGEPLFCDDACRAAGEQMREKVSAVMPSDTTRMLCHHSATVGGRCIECGQAVR